MPTRRQALSHAVRLAALMAGAGLLPPAAQAAYEAKAFDAVTLAELTAALGVATPVASADVSLTAPDIAENGAAVPMTVATRLAGARRLMLLVEKNPALLAVLFDLSDSVEPSVITRVKMGQSSNVYAVAVMNDGRVLYAVKDVRVTLGGCG